MIKIKKEQELPPISFIIENELYQVFFNILLNAYQHSILFYPPQIIPISINIKKLSIKEKKFIAIDIKDKGPGIHYCDYKNIFEPGITTKPDGAGLGLYLCKRLLNQASGDFFVKESFFYLSTTFRVILPITNL